MYLPLAVPGTGELVLPAMRVLKSLRHYSLTNLYPEPRQVFVICVPDVDIAYPPESFVEGG